MHFIVDTVVGVKDIFTKTPKNWVRVIDYTMSLLTSHSIAFF